MKKDFSFLCQAAAAGFPNALSRRFFAASWPLGSVWGQLVCLRAEVPKTSFSRQLAGFFFAPVFFSSHSGFRVEHPLLARRTGSRAVVHTLNMKKGTRLNNSFFF
ncbi:MAG: hypothetical protein WCS31_00880 [Verrucomicrobiae bacterium]